MKSPKELTSSKLRVSVYWGDVLYDTAICRPLESITIGRGAGNTYILDLPNPTAGPSVELVRMNADGSAEVAFDDFFRGHIKAGSRLLSLVAAREANHLTKDSHGLYRARLHRNENADFVVGLVSFYLDWTDENLPIAKGQTTGSRRFTISLLFTCVLATLIMALLSPGEDEEEETPPERMVQLISRQKFAKAAVGDRKSADGGAQKGEIGKADLAPKATAEESAADKVKNMNLGRLVGGLSKIADKAPSIKGAPSQAASAITQTGTGGFSTEGLKTGGGGKSVGVGRTVGQGEGGFEGTGRLGLSGNSPVEGGIGHGNADGPPRDVGLDRDLIDSIVRRRQDRIRLCYERQLNFDPKLSGKVAIHFVIGTKGEVVRSSITEDTMKNEAVRKCILAEVKSWTFPQPKGGVLVDVDYPFFFESSRKGG